jgi:hypothetical protein
MISLNEVKKFLLKTQVVHFLSQCGIAAAAASPTIVCCLFPPASPRPSRDACWPPRQSFRPFGHPAHQHVGCTARQSPHLAGCADPPADPTALLAFCRPFLPPQPSHLAGRMSRPASLVGCPSPLVGWSAMSSAPVRLSARSGCQQSRPGCRRHCPTSQFIRPSCPLAAPSGCKPVHGEGDGGHGSRKSMGRLHRGGGGAQSF